MGYWKKSVFPETARAVQENLTGYAACPYYLIVDPPIGSFQTGFERDTWFETENLAQ